ncbi:MAG: tetratricopeptide repeat protein [Gammaproteobacteria bacterium]|nr:tetratricopeptide repeat protein [Gammaproteobacteria bacterium]
MGRDKCVGCHAKEISLWQGSHHDLAMQEAEADLILGNFDNATFSYNGIVTTFHKKDDKFFINTDGPDGKLTDYEVKYVFGIEPLQQYLLELPRGHLQSFPIAWDTRTKEHEGQRWFHLYADEQIDFNDELHWTGINQNWNYMCADCHSTNLRKNFNLENNTYQTSWSEIDVSCEACHGPASKHIELAKSLNNSEFRNLPDKGLAIRFPIAGNDKWSFPKNSSIAKLQSLRSSIKLIDTCARCHSRRSSLNSSKPYLGSLHDNYLVSSLDQGLYHADGQMNDETYVYGSFIQSKMYRAGVNCIDCHNAHSLELLEKGNALCLQCHKQTKFDTESHHFHPADTAAAQCVSCHMPAKNYMVIDSRRDHSFRVPRPDLSISTSSPNACNQCHSNKSNEWSLSKMKQWYKKESFPHHFAETIHTGRKGSVNAKELLLTLAENNQQPMIARATAMNLLQNYLDPTTLKTVRNGLSSKEPMIQISALNALDVLPSEERFQLAGSLLNDPIKSVRIQAASKLASVSRSGLDDKQTLQLETAIAEYITVQKGNSDRAFAHVNLGNLYIDLTRYDDAEHAYKKAIELERSFVPAFVNLADLYRLQNSEQKAESTLREAIAVNDHVSAVHHALGLSLVRQKRYEEGLLNLERASQIDPVNTQYNYVYAVALNSMGFNEKAITVLEDIHKHHPTNRQALLSLTSINQQTGNLSVSINYAEKLLILSPDDKSLQNYIDQMKK